MEGESETIVQGDMFLIRPHDRHGHGIFPDKQFELININFTTEEFLRLCEYTGRDLKAKVDASPKPLKVKLDNVQLRHLENSHEFLNFYSGDEEQFKVRMRFLLAETFSYFLKAPSESADMSTREWLKIVMTRMSTQENIEKGMDALLTLSGFSHGHLCRLMKQYFNTTPLAYISELRLTYASNLLVNSSMDVNIIAQRVGYASESHFIKAFREKFAATPYKYRKMYANKYINKRREAI